MIFSTDFGNGDVLLWFFEIFLFVVWFWLLIAIFGDLFRDHELSGGVKALWAIFIIVVPFLGIFIYLIVRGGGMAARSAKQMQAAQTQFDDYVRTTAAAQSPTEQIAHAKQLLDAGTITQADFDALKAKALA
jgi:hypothetical protein